MASKYLKLALTALPSLVLGGCLSGEEGAAGDDEIGKLLEPVVVAVPARIEAENYERVNESTPASNFGAARPPSMLSFGSSARQ